MSHLFPHGLRLIVSAGWRCGHDGVRHDSDPSHHLPDHYELSGLRGSLPQATQEHSEAGHGGMPSSMSSLVV